jgi:hypothetical protein
MSSTGSTSNYGLFYREELMAAASFSNGRKMNRLPADKRSYELIRFCSRAGYTVTGGLSKLLKHFVREKDAGDVMTYVDKQFSEGKAFLKAGFRKEGESQPRHFLVHKKTFECLPLDDEKRQTPDPHHYIYSTAGNLKLVFVP